MWPTSFLHTCRCAGAFNDFCLLFSFCFRSGCTTLWPTGAAASTWTRCVDSCRVSMPDHANWPDILTAVRLLPGRHPTHRCTQLASFLSESVLIPCTVSFCSLTTWRATRSSAASRLAATSTASCSSPRWGGRKQLDQLIDSLIASVALHCNFKRTMQFSKVGGGGGRKGCHSLQCSEDSSCSCRCSQPPLARPPFALAGHWR